MNIKPEVQPRDSQPNLNRQANIEIGILLFAFWLPSLLSALDSFVFGATIRFSQTSAFYMLYECGLRSGRILIIGLLIWIAGWSLREFGITRLLGRHVVVGVGVFLVMLASAVAYFWVDYNYQLGGRSPAGSAQTSLTDRVIIMLVGVVFEEFFYRCYLQTRLLDLRWRNASILVFTAVLFASYHIYEGPAVLPLIFLHGIVLGAVFMRTKSIWPGLIAHWLYDLFLILFPWAWRAMVQHH